MASLSSSKLHSGYLSNSSNDSNNKKRPFVAKDEKSGSLSGYSADREEKSLSAPVASIDLHGTCRKVHNYDPNGCQKRQKTQELQFAASSVKADLARAGVPYPELQSDIQSTTFPGETINLKNVRLVFSRDMKPSNVSASASLKSSISDYEQLLAQCCDLYRHKPRRQVISKKDSMSSNDSDGRSTSSVSDTESDSCHSGNGSSAAFVASPLLEDSLVPPKHGVATTRPSTAITTCHIVSRSSSSKAATMSDILRLCKQPRLVVTSTAPYTVVHANAAFARLTGLVSNQMLGKPFSELLSQIKEGSRQHVDLPGYAMSSSIGSNQTLPMRMISAGQEKTVDCEIKVVAIVGRKTDEASEVSHVTHFGIDVVEAGGNPSTSVNECPIQRALTAATGNHLAVGVMG